MRPLAVLCLVLAAAGLVLFLVFKDSPEESGHEGTASPNAPSQPEPRGQTEAVRPATDGTRQVERQVTTATPDNPRQGIAASTQRFSNGISGKVTNGQDNSPIEGAVLTLYRGTLDRRVEEMRMVLGTGEDRSESGSTRTKADGRYAFSSLEPGNEYTLVCEADGFQSRDLFLQVPQTGEVVVDIAMQSGVALRGMVADEGGNPIPGATVSLGSARFGLMNQGANPQTGPTATTDSQGYYEFPSVSRPTMSVTASAPGFATTTQPEIRLAGSDEPVEVNFNLDTGKAISGRLAAPTGEGVPGATVEVFGYQPRDQTWYAEARSENDGTFVIPDLRPGMYVVQARAEGWSEGRYPQAEAGDVGLEISMSKQRAVTGKVTDGASGDPVDEFTVHVHRFNHGAETHGASLRNKRFRGRAEGQFEMGGFDPGSYVVRVVADGYAPSYSEMFVIADGEDGPFVEVRLTEGGRISGRVVDARSGKPVVGATVSTQDNRYVENPLTNLLGSRIPRRTTARSVTTDSEGRFLLTALEAGEYQLQITHPDYPARILQDIELADGGRTAVPDVSMQAGGSVRGHVFDGASEPLAGATVSLTLASGAGFQGPADARTGPDGAFVISNIAPGLYKISASRPANPNNQNPFTVILDRNQTEREIVIEGGRAEEIDIFLNLE